jgi:hypothetical protein
MAISSPKNLIVVAMKLIEGNIDENDAAIADTAFYLANYARDNEFKLSPAFSNLHHKYASLSGVDHIIFGSDVDTQDDTVAWIESQTGEPRQQIEALAWHRLFEMKGTRNIKEGVRVRFSVISYFYLPE